MEFSIIGNQIEASLFLLDANYEKNGGAISSVSYEAESTIEGYMGLRYGNTSGDSGAMYRDFVVTPIPEPSTVSAIMAALALALAWVYRRRR